MNVEDLLSKLNEMNDGERIHYNGYLIKYDEDSWFGNQYRVYKNGSFIENSIKADDILKFVTTDRLPDSKE